MSGGNYSGDAGDCLSGHFGQQFSTKDRDSSCHCAQRYKGGWWFSDCFDSHLNGEYLSGVTSTDTPQGVIWYTWKGSHYSLKTVEMKVRPTRHV